MNLTLLDLAKLKLGDREIGLIEESLKTSPELNLVAARTISGTSYHTLIRNGLPTVGFRGANEGVTPSKSTFENRLIECFIASGMIEVDRAIADAHEDGPAALQMIEAKGILESAFRHIGSQFYYGENNDKKGFPGLIASYDSANMEINVTGATAKTSVWLLKFGMADIQFVFGKNSPLNLGDFREETITKDGKSLDGYVAHMTSWVGLQVASKNSAVRIKNIGTAAEKTLIDQHLYDALDKFPSGVTPDVILMTRRSRGQLRTSRTATNEKGKPAPMPMDFEGIPIKTTDSITLNEA